MRRNRDYGGYDMFDPNPSFWNVEELTDLQYAINDILDSRSVPAYVNKIWVGNDDTELEADCEVVAIDEPSLIRDFAGAEDYIGSEFTSYLKVDFRRIKSPSDLERRYAREFADIIEQDVIKLIFSDRYM